MEKKIISAMTSSKKSGWGTPQKFFNLCNARYHFDLDCAAHAENAKLPNYISPEDDAFTTDWSTRGSRGWLNPEYGDLIGIWLKRAVEMAVDMKLLVILVPARIDTQWWWHYALTADRIIFLKGRLKFEGAESTALFPSALLEFRNERELGDLPTFDWWDWRKDTYALSH